MPSKGYLVSPVLLQAVVSPAGWTDAPVVIAGWTPLSTASLTSTGNYTFRRLKFNIFAVILNDNTEKKGFVFMLPRHAMLVSKCASTTGVSILNMVPDKIYISYLLFTVGNLL